jgi:hypothetical protein
MFSYIASATALFMCCGYAVPRNARRHLGVGHHRRAFGHLVADVPQLLDVRLIGFAEIPPDAGVARHDVRLIAAVGDDRVGALRQAQVFAAVLHADAHQLDGIERRAAAPRRAGRMRGLAFERVLDRDHAVAAAFTPRHAEVVGDVGEEDDVDILEHAVAHEPRFEASCSSATPGHSMIVPGILSRSMMRFTAIAAMMFIGIPVLCPSP